MDYKLLANDKVKMILSLQYKNDYYYNVYDLYDNPIGECDLYLDDDEDAYYYGNIGYEIFEEYRGHHYSEECSKLLLKLAQSFGIKNVTITANPKNKASLKIIRSLGAKYIEVVKVPRKCKLYKQGSKRVERYLLETNGGKAI